MLVVIPKVKSRARVSSVAASFGASPPPPPPPPSGNNSLRQAHTPSMLVRGGGPPRPPPPPPPPSSSASFSAPASAPPPPPPPPTSVSFSSAPPPAAGVQSYGNLSSAKASSSSTRGMSLLKALPLKRSDNDKSFQKMKGQKEDVVDHFEKALQFGTLLKTK